MVETNRQSFEFVSLLFFSHVSLYHHHHHRISSHLRTHLPSNRTLHAQIIRPDRWRNVKSKSLHFVFRNISKKEENCSNIDTRGYFFVAIRAVKRQNDEPKFVHALLRGIRHLELVKLVQNLSVTTCRTVETILGWKVAKEK